MALVYLELHMELQWNSVLPSTFYCILPESGYGCCCMFLDIFLYVSVAQTSLLLHVRCQILGTCLWVGLNSFSSFNLVLCVFHCVLLGCLCMVMVLQFNFFPICSFSRFVISLSVVSLWTISALHNFIMQFHDVNLVFCKHTVLNYLCIYKCPAHTDVDSRILEALWTYKPVKIRLCLQRPRFILSQHMNQISLSN